MKERPDLSVDNPTLREEEVTTFEQAVDYLRSINDMDTNIYKHENFEEYLQDKGYETKEEMILEDPTYEDEILNIENLFNSGVKPIYEYGHNAWRDVIITSSLNEVLNFVNPVFSSKETEIDNDLHKVEKFNEEQEALKEKERQEQSQSELSL